MSGFFEKLVYRLVVVGRTRSGILERAKETAWFDSRPPQGPGRVDTFNPYKVLFGFDMATDDSVGTVDLPSLWNQRPRRGLWLHWDGNNDLVEERNKSAAIGAGATPDSLDVAGARARRGVDPGSEASGVSRRAHRCRAGRAGPRRLSDRLRVVPRPGHARDRSGHAARRDRRPIPSASTRSPKSWRRR